MKDSAIIVSGGMDSITLLYDKQEEIALGISFNYGSNHNKKELAFAKLHCERLGIKHIVIDLDFMPRYLKSSLMEGADAIPDGNYDDDNMKSTVIDAAAKAGTYIHVGVEAPYTHWRKEDIALRGHQLGINYAETWSCYKGGEKHCGTCGTCRERKEAFRLAHLQDPTAYEQ